MLCVMVVCYQPQVCVPLHLLLPFLVALAHRHGYLQWFKREWVTLAFWLALFRLARPKPQQAQEAKETDQELVEHYTKDKAGEAEGPTDAAGTPGGDVQAAGAPQPAAAPRQRAKAS